MSEAYVELCEPQVILRLTPTEALVLRIMVGTSETSGSSDIQRAVDNLVKLLVPLFPAVDSGLPYVSSRTVFRTTALHGEAVTDAYAKSKLASRGHKA